MWAITGGGGYVGGTLARRLSQSGETVRILTRKPAGPNAVISEITGDICSDPALAALVTGATIVVHLAAYVHRAARTPAEIAECERTNVDGTRALIDAIATHAPGAFLIFVSSASVYAQSGEPLRETSACEPSTVYGRTKLAAEQLVLDAQRSGRIRACILRPAMIFGHGAPGNLARLASLARRGWILRLSASPAHKSLLPVDTAVDAFLAVARQPERADGKVFNLTGGPPLTTAAIASNIAAAFGRRARTLVLPRSPLVLAARLADTTLRLVPLRLPAFGQLISSYTSDAVLDDASFRETFAFEPRMTVTDAILRTFPAR